MVAKRFIPMKYVQISMHGMNPEKKTIIHPHISIPIMLSAHFLWVRSSVFLVKSPFWWTKNGFCWQNPVASLVFIVARIFGGFWGEVAGFNWFPEWRCSLVSYIYMYLGKLQRPHCSPSLEIMVSKGNHPQMAARFRLVKIYIYNVVNIWGIMIGLFHDISNIYI